MESVHGGVSHWAIIARFSPLTGIKFVESSLSFSPLALIERFSPLTGIKFVESLDFAVQAEVLVVSVPLRGLSSWKV